MLLPTILKKKFAMVLNLMIFCILCKQRVQDYSPAIIKALKEKNIRARIEIEYQDLIKEPIIELILDIISCSVNIKQAEQKWGKIKENVINIFSINSDNSVTYEELQQQIFDLKKQYKKYNGSKF